MDLYKNILLKREYNHKMLAVLIDPDQCRGSVLASTVAALKTDVPDFIFIGGSHTVNSSLDSLIELIKDEVRTNVILFPGNASQFSAKADAILYLSLLSGRNAEYLIGQHLNNAIAVKQSNVEVIPTGYLLIDGGKPSSVEYISNTRPIPRDKNEIALSTAVAGELLGMRLIYLEAGSGAAISVPVEMIKYVSQGLSLPLIVGGGLRTTEEMISAFDAGADIVVVGNAFEEQPTLISAFVQTVKRYNGRGQLI